MENIRVLLAEDQKLIRAGLKALLESIPGVEVVAEANNGHEVLDMVEKQDLDLVFMDIAMPLLNGIETLRMLKSGQDNPKVIILSMHTSKEYVWQALRAGAKGYVVKDAEVSELEFAIKSVISNQIFLSPFISKHVVTGYLWHKGEPNLFDGLTPRQRQMLQMIAEGQTTKQIAATLQIGIKTAETHRMQLMDYLDIHDITGLVRYAIRMGLVSVED